MYVDSKIVLWVVNFDTLPSDLLASEQNSWFADAASIYSNRTVLEENESVNSVSQLAWQSE